jgi:hypothetical protein
VQGWQKSPLFGISDFTYKAKDCELVYAMDFETKSLLIE